MNEKTGLSSYITAVMRSLARKRSTYGGKKIAKRWDYTLTTRSSGPEAEKEVTIDYLSLQTNLNIHKGDHLIILDCYFAGATVIGTKVRYWKLAASILHQCSAHTAYLINYSSLKSDISYMAVLEKWLMILPSNFILVLWRKICIAVKNHSIIWSSWKTSFFLSRRLRNSC